MKSKYIPLIVGALAVVLLTVKMFAADPGAVPQVEYATIRWDDKENIHVIRAGGQVEFLWRDLRKTGKPGGADDRAFYMTLAMNGLAKEGFEFAGMIQDEIVMKRGR